MPAVACVVNLITYYPLSLWSVEAKVKSTVVAPMVLLIKEGRAELSDLNT
jgi:hypothetical protein